MKMGNGKHRGLKICCGVSTLLFIILLVVLLVLFLTVLKPKEPIIIPLPVTLENIELFLPTLQLNVSLGLTVTIDNPNYGGFQYKDNTSFISYRGTIVAEAPISHDTIPARGKHNISTTAQFSADKLIPNPYFLLDYASGILNFTSSTTLQGKVIVIKFFKLKATTYSTCDISVFINAESVESQCHSKVQF